MKYLAYGLFADYEPLTLPSCHGIDQQPLLVIRSSQHINVAISKVIVPLSNEVATLLNYSQIIESLHEQYSIIPVRYGCLFEQESQIQQWIAKNATVYQNLLEKIKDCVEMGIRILPTTLSPFKLPLMEKGKDYLKARQQFYFAQDQLIAEQKILIQTFHHQFSHYIKASKQEYHATSGLTSLYFLVPRIHISIFREIFTEIDNNTTIKLLMSGPWAPYNFVDLI